MPDSNSRPPRHPSWENGWSPDSSRVPGTRRLWLAGAMAIATVAACVTAITVTENQAADPSLTKDRPADASASGPGLISYPTPTPTDSGAHTPGRTSASPGGRTPTSDSALPHPAATGPATDPAESLSPSPSSSPTKASTSRRSVRSVNYPDRYWKVSGGLVTLDPVGDPRSREDATFDLVKGLADSSCHSFATSDGRYLRHREFVLRAEPDDGSALFEQDATFCPREAPASGAVLLESVNYPGRYLRHQHFRLRLDPYRRGGADPADFSFRLVDGLA